MNKKQLQNKIKKLEQQVEQLQTKPFPWLACFGSVIGGLLCYLWYFVLVESWNVLQMGQCLNDMVCTPSHLLIIPNLLFAYVLVAGTVISFVALCKGGYDKLKQYDEEGLIFGIFVPIVGLIYGLIGGIIFGLIIGLIFGLIVGLIYGLIEEFGLK